MKSSTAERGLVAVLVGPRRPDQAADLGQHDLGLLLGLGGAIGVVGLEPPQAGAELGVLGWHSSDGSEAVLRRSVPR